MSDHEEEEFVEPKQEEEEYEEPRGCRKRKEKVAVFDESGMTEDDRRKLRKSQRMLHHKVEQEVGRGEDEDVMEFLGRKREDNNKLFNKVAYTREAALDADNAELIAKKTLQHVDRMVQVPRFDATKLANKLRSKLSVGQGASKHFSWNHLGLVCGGCFNAVPSGVSFLAGTMDRHESVVKKARKPRAKRYDASLLQEQKPELVDNGNKGTADNLSAAEKAMKTMKKKLKKYSHRREGDKDEREVDGVQFLFNPKSFTQTVENIFHYSFLVKTGEGQIRVRSQKEAEEEGCMPGLTVKQMEKEDDDDDNHGVEDRTQSVVAFTMKDWRRIIAAHELEEGLLPHRTGSKQQSRALSQHSSQSQHEE